MRLPSLYLTYVDETIVEFDAIEGEDVRHVTVKVGAGPLRFPNIDSAAGETFGNPRIDLYVRRRAQEELTRFRCYRDAA